MFSIKSLFVVVVGLSTLTLAAPIETAPTNTTAIADGCKDAYRGEHGACEDARDQKHAGEREEHRGEREIHNGNVGQGLADMLHGIGNQAIGQGRECASGGRC
ncbi:hypothetical protein Vi05172_g4546 [Venturia inaequalis]|nr:hypothetical protein Vi05172_g4546 [Venturia inaequalis]